MPLVHACSSPGCSTLTMGALCLEHEREHATAPEPQRTRFLAVAAAAAAVAGFAAAFVARHV